MFRGANAINLDSKGRLAMPTRYRETLMQRCQGQLVCTIDIKDPCLLLYPLPAWEAIELKLQQLSSMHPAERRMQRLLLGYATEVEMDKNGRLLLSAPLRQHANLDKKLMLVGQLNKFEIWDEQTWADQVEADKELELSGTEPFSERLQDFSL
ncbi:MULTISPECIES: division/cell wall cluster transcriptional repressor MraZ [Corallincola]|uniref:Transcriptional regulator MraZ n=3 Tax=Corallincola TaxID=1775176 RepID=A0A368NI92_9GAMM|nr:MULTISPECIES: division/cell wall cluster transcriptional repressor MraZ [Corallincola]RCU49876.1 transcriptional regulator MraZ [Corallincola holothuriorum]TAA45144.1 transcriptional regulator MraZ [Corallincola spongiicola]TCI03579.1 transcriptional regulator MraZ [Corallincola luteus]